MGYILEEIDTENKNYKDHNKFSDNEIYNIEFKKIM